MDNLSYMLLLEGMPEMIRLHILQYLINAPFKVYYHKIKKCLYICIDKNYPIITRVLNYKQSNPPEYNLYTVGNSSSLKIKLNLCGRVIMTEVFTYLSNIFISYQRMYDLKTQRLINKFHSNKINRKKEIKTINNLSEKEEKQEKEIKVLFRNSFTIILSIFILKKYLK